MADDDSDKNKTEEQIANPSKRSAEQSAIIVAIATFFGCIVLSYALYGTITGFDIGLSFGAAIVAIVFRLA